MRSAGLLVRHLFGLLCVATRLYAFQVPASCSGYRSAVSCNLLQNKFSGPCHIDSEKSARVTSTARSRTCYMSLDDYQDHLSPRVWPVFDVDAPIGAPQTGTGHKGVGMWTANAMTCDLRGGNIAEATKKETIPSVPGAFLIHNVLTATECEQLIDVTEGMGYAEHDLEKNTHAAVTWIADSDSVVRELFSRIRKHLPQELKGVSHRRTLAGLNERLRFYRYQPNGFHTFRKHMDDSFPASGLDRQNGNRFVWDLTDGQQSSVFTFLLYLTDEFGGGETTFFPYDAENQRSTAVLEEVRVKPRAGSVLCFYQTLRMGSEDNYFSLAPVHEGSPVQPLSGRHSRPKYVIRSDVLYTLE